MLVVSDGFELFYYYLNIFYQLLVNSHFFSNKQSRNTAKIKKYLVEPRFHAVKFCSPTRHEKP